MAKTLVLLLLFVLKCFSECPENDCSMICKNGYARDSNGCLICQCATCPKTACNLQCQFGYKKNKFGCLLCQCNLHNKCYTPHCETDCPAGFLKDKRGCRTCECASEEIQEKCDSLNCPNWTDCKEIATGCEGAWEEDCKPKITVSCLKVCIQLKCKACKSGYLVGPDGCRTCRCIDPCEGVTCPSNQKCLADHSEYSYTCSPKKCKCPQPQPPSYLSRLATRDICNGCNSNCDLFGCGEYEKCCADWYGCMSCVDCRY